MNDTEQDAFPKSATLCGLLNPVGSKVGFLLPVFRSGDSSFIQDMAPTGDISRFIRYEPRDGEIAVNIEAAERTLVARVSQPVVYAFRLPNSQIFVCEYARLADLLRGREHELKSFPFANLEVLKFIGSYDRARSLLSKARNLLALDSGNLADRWVGDQLKVLDETRHLTALHHPGVGTRAVYDRGFLSYWEFQDELRSLAEQEQVILVRLKLVRSCSKLPSSARHLVGTFGLRPDKLNSESRELSLPGGMVKTLLAYLGDRVLVLSAEVRGATRLAIVATNADRIRLRYFKKSEAKKVKGRGSDDYFYSRG